MPDYPPDIMEKARECAHISWRPGLTLSEAFAAAILAERQRCAEVARGKEFNPWGKTDSARYFGADRWNWTKTSQYGKGRFDAADAIMNPEPTDDR